MKTLFCFFTSLYCIAAVSSCECINPICSDYPMFKMTDARTQGSLFFSATPLYNFDSVYVTTPSDSFTLRLYTTDSLTFIPSPFREGTDSLYVHYNLAETDTLRLNYQHSRHTYCCPNGYAHITSITNNGSVLNKEDNVFIIEK